MATVVYTIVSGAAPFVAELTPSFIPNNFHDVPGTYEFDDVPNGGYSVIVTDSNGCQFEQQITVDPFSTTTTTTVLPGSAIVIGNTQDQSLIFNVQGTNRSTHYSGYPNPTTSSLYMWLKTNDGAPLTIQRVVNYSIQASGNSTFVFDSVSDEIHTGVVQGASGPATQITGQLVLHPGFIETYFKYIYVQDPFLPNFEINLSSTGNWLNPDIPLVDVVNIYGVTYVDNDNAIMDF
jgi:hypothetical protein